MNEQIERRKDVVRFAIVIQSRMALHIFNELCKEYEARIKELEEKLNEAETTLYNEQWGRDR